MGAGVIRGTTLHHPPLPPLGGHGVRVLVVPQVAPELADVGASEMECDNLDSTY